MSKVEAKLAAVASAAVIVKVVSSTDAADDKSDPDSETVITNCYN